jgi:fucose permease
MIIDWQFCRGAVAGLMAGWLLGQFGITGVILAAACCYVLWVLYVKKTKEK